MNSFSVTWTNEKASDPPLAGSAQTPAIVTTAEHQEPLHPTSLMRGIFRASGMIRSASTPNHCSTSDA